MQKWEYLVAPRAPEDQYLNSLGEEGWELVGFTQQTSQSSETEARQFVFVFKRPWKA
jgi:Domain of unknown function (DUF4177)